MKRINSIYRIFVLFLIIIVGSFLILYWYSSANLKVSLQRVAKIQMEYSFDQLDQKVKEIKLEASAVLASEDMKLLQVAIVDQEDIYSYVMKVKTMQQIFQEKQKTNSGMAEFVLYWPDEKRIVSSSTISGIKDKSVLSELEDNRWIISEGEIYFCRCYKTTWASDDDEPYLLIRMERDWLYRIKNMASGFDGGGTLALLLGALYLLMYNRNILMQLNMLTYKLKRVEDGDWTTQITQLPDNEFYYVFDQFNHMIVHMNELLDETLKEQELRMQAELEQLQLQINPHFLYNSLSYIVTVAEEPDAVRSMAVHLSRYYRYCTQKKMITTIKEEVSYARSYLEIMAMRKRIRYSIDMSQDIGELPIIPLILEPLIENAIEHGLEGCESAKQIEIVIGWAPSRAVTFAISDDGEGMTKEQIAALKERISRKERKEEESVGLWNVNQRLINYYSKSAALGFRRSRWGGLTVYFTIQPERKAEIKEGK